jgi:hypothetical protein
LRTPGIEPGSQAWKARMLPLYHVRVVVILEVRNINSVPSKGGRSVLHAYNGSVAKSLVELFPEIGLEEGKFAIAPRMLPLPPSSYCHCNLIILWFAVHHNHNCMLSLLFL